MDAMSTVYSYLRVPIAVTSVIVAALSGLLYWKQNEIIYPRSMPPGARTEVPKPKDFPQYENMENYEELFLDTPDGEKVHGFWLRPGNQRAYSQTGRGVTIMMLHGNAGNVGHRLPIAGVLDQYFSANIVMLEYRGYGLSTGTPDENGINVDTQTGLEWIRKNQELKNTHIVIYGQSIGGAAAIQVVARNQDAGDIKALVLENTFLSIRKMIPAALPPAKYVAFLCHQIWPSEETMPKIKVPVLFLSGANDEIVPPEHMTKLHQLCTHVEKEIHVFPGYDHNNTVAAPGYFDAMSDFLTETVVKG